MASKVDLSQYTTNELLEEVTRREDVLFFYHIEEDLKALKESIEFQIDKKITKKQLNGFVKHINRGIGDFYEEEFEDFCVILDRHIEHYFIENKYHLFDE